MKLKLFTCCCILAIIFNSCSIQKRVHRPGYAIGWNLGSKHRNTTHTKKAALKTTGQQEPLAATPLTAQVETPCVTRVETVNKQPIAPPVAHHGKAKVESMRARTVLQQQEQQLKVYPVHKQQSASHQKTTKDYLFKGLLLVLVAALFLGLGLIFASVLGLFGVIFLLIFGIAAIVFLVVGLVFMIIGLVE